MESRGVTNDPWLGDMVNEFDSRLTLHFLEFELELDMIIALAKLKLDNYEAFSVGSRPDLKLNHMIGVLGYFSSIH